MEELLPEVDTTQKGVVKFLKQKAFCGKTKIKIYYSGGDVYKSNTCSIQYGINGISVYALLSLSFYDPIRNSFYTYLLRNTSLNSELLFKIYARKNGAFKEFIIDTPSISSSIIIELHAHVSGISITETTEDISEWTEVPIV